MQEEFILINLSSTKEGVAGSSDLTVTHKVEQLFYSYFLENRLSKGVILYLGKCSIYSLELVQSYCINF
jgi:hypothetical protein